MGCYVDVNGRLELDKKLQEEHYELLLGLNKTRRVSRSPKELKKMGFDGSELKAMGFKNGYGSNGELFVFADRIKGYDSSIIDDNMPPYDQPGLNCHWRPTEDRLGIEWDGCDNFIDYKEWIKYISEKILLPLGYKISGSVEVEGPGPYDHYMLTIESKKRVISMKETQYPDPLLIRYCHTCYHAEGFMNIPPELRKDYVIVLDEYDYKYCFNPISIVKKDNVRDRKVYFSGEELADFTTKDDMGRYMRRKFKKEGFKIYFYEFEVFQGYTYDGERKVTFYNWLMSDENIDKDTISFNEDMIDIENYKC